MFIVNDVVIDIGVNDSLETALQQPFHSYATDLHVHRIGIQLWECWAIGDVSLSTIKSY